MPYLADWIPTAMAKLLVTEKSRRKRDVTPANEKIKQQFKGIFPEARHIVTKPMQ